MNNDPYPWPYYADLQQRSRKVSRMGDYAWGIDCALDYLLGAIATGSVPAEPDELVAALNRAIASGARLHRSRSVALSTFAPAEVSTSADDPAAEARIELTRIVRLVSSTDQNVLVDAGLGYTDREIADRLNSTPGAVRVRLSRLRLKLAA